MEKPKQLELEAIDLQELRNICQEYINFVDDDTEYHEDNDYKQFIYEVAMETIFGPDIWKFINKRRK
jgi:hypothetical protein